MIKTVFLAFAIVFSAASVAGADPMDVTSLSIQSGETLHAFSVEIADDAEETATGLMNREAMDADKGMLFDFGGPYTPNMFMRNTLISLDILFIDASGEIVMIAQHAAPGSERRLSPGSPVRAVLELNGGRTSALGIKPGHVVRHTLFGNEGEEASLPDAGE